MSHFLAEQLYKTMLSIHHFLVKAAHYSISQSLSIYFLLIFAPQKLINK